MDAPPQVQPESISDMCFVQALFVRRCLRYGEARQIACDIYGTDDRMLPSSVHCCRRWCCGLQVNCCSMCADGVFKDALERIGERLHALKMVSKKLKHFVRAPDVHTCRHVDLLPREF